MVLGPQSAVRWPLLRFIAQRILARLRSRRKSRVHTMTLHPWDHKVFTSARREHFEELRKNHVSRFLFRAYTISSGGGPNVCINDTSTIIPAAFWSSDLQRSAHPLSFYSMSEAHVHTLVDAHYHGRETPMTVFSSWSQSLHLVLWYANWLHKDSSAKESVYVAVMDTRHLEKHSGHEVMVWNVKQLRGSWMNHECLAYGRISGKGYKAVPFEKLHKAGIYDWFPELGTHWDGQFGFKVRHEMFDPAKFSRANDLTLEGLKKIKDMARLFGNLAFPVAVALICLRQRPWVISGISGNRAPSPLSQFLNFLWQELGDLEVDLGMEGEIWLQEGSVDTTNFPDVKQWIDVLRGLVKCGLEGWKSKAVDDHPPPDVPVMQSFFSHYRAYIGARSMVT